MYYYLLEQQRDKNGQRFRERLTDLTTDFGVAGEIVVQSPLKTVEELLDLGIKKDYSTIVAVGSDGHIHRVITALMQRDPDERPVLGVIPLAGQSLVGVMLGVTTLRHAIETLKFRHLAYATLVHVDPNKYILTQASISTKRPTAFTVDIDTAHLEVMATDVIITGDCHLEIQNRGNEALPILKSLAWFVGASMSPKSISRFHGQKIRIQSAIPLGLQQDDETIAKTPVMAKIVRRALKIIRTRATITQENHEPAKEQSAI